jgi:hypothetical protein
MSAKHPYEVYEQDGALISTHVSLAAASKAAKSLARKWKQPFRVYYSLYRSRDMVAEFGGK